MLTRLLASALHYGREFLVRIGVLTPQSTTDSVTARSETEVTATTHVCMHAALQHEEPKLYVLAYSAQLIKEGWNEADAAQVWIRTLRALAKTDSFLGSDHTAGNSDDDFAIAGFTDHDHSEEALCHIMEQWDSDCELRLAR